MVMESSKNEFIGQVCTIATKNHYFWDVTVLAMDLNGVLVEDRTVTGIFKKVVKIKTTFIPMRTIERISRVDRKPIAS